MKKTQRSLKGFTLIELLVVIGILSILAVALLIAINPAEAQRKARDTQRLKDMANIQGALEGWLNDNPGSSMTLSVNSAGGTRDCNTGWLTAGGSYRMCNYMNRLPQDPRNTSTQLTDNTGSAPFQGLAAYMVRASGGIYNICTYLESQSNARKLDDDGLTAGNVFNVYSSTSALVTCP